MAAIDAPPQGGSALSFTQGLLLGQLSVVLLLGAFIKFFIFGDPPSADATANLRATERRSRTLAHKRSLLSLRASSGSGGGIVARRHSASHSRRPSASSSSSLPSSGSGGNGTGGKKPPASAPPILRSAPLLGAPAILSKTYYNVPSHQPESLDWLNVLLAQTVARLRSDAQQDDAVLASLAAALNGPARPDFVDEIRITELSLGEEFPIFSNCRIIPVDEDGMSWSGSGGGGGGGNGGSGGGDGGGGGGAGDDGSPARLQARMDVDLSDFITLGLETRLLLNFPRPRIAVLPVALAVTVVRFSGTLSVSFLPPAAAQPSPTMLTFCFLDDYRLDLSVRSLVGSRSRLQDVPKVAQLVEGRLHAWFDERCVEPFFQQIALPSLWPRKKNTRGGEDGAEGVGVGAAGRGEGGGGASPLGKARGKEVERDLREEARREIEAEAEVRRELEREREREGMRMRRRRASGRDDYLMPGSMPGLTIA